jgi:hypothetical protein
LTKQRGSNAERSSSDSTGGTVSCVPIKDEEDEEEEEEDEEEEDEVGDEEEEDGGVAEGVCDFASV